MTAPAGAPAELLGRWRRGEQLLAGTVGQLPDGALSGPTLLPGWDRARLLAHVAGNADALVNLLTWARTGVETPMYPSAEIRDAQIAGTAALPPARLRAEVLAASGRLAAAVGTLPVDAWAVQVRTAQGRVVPAAEVPWMRCREVWVHAVDLAGSTSFADVPDEVLVALVEDVFATWDRWGQQVDVAVSAAGRRWGSGAVLVDGRLADVTGWVTGRSAGAGLSTAGALPELPAWL